MNILVCVKRVPDIGARIELTEDRRAIVTKNLGFTVSPHEECAVEEAVQIRDSQGGSATVLTLGPGAADEQLRDALALGVDEGLLLKAEDGEWDPEETARAIVQTVQAKQQDGTAFDLLLFGNETGDTGDAQVAVRVAEALDMPCLTGLKDLEIKDGKAVGKRESDKGWDLFEADLPAAVAVKEGINLPHFPSLRGRMKAKKKTIETFEPQRSGPQLRMLSLENPPEQGKQVEMLGSGPEAAPKVVEVLKSLEVL